MPPCDHRHVTDTVNVAHVRHPYFWQDRHSVTLSDDFTFTIRSIPLEEMARFNFQKQGRFRSV